MKTARDGRADAAGTAPGSDGPRVLRAYLGEGPLRGRTTEAVTEALREAILDGAIAASTWLREDELAAVFEVSRTPVREALRLLADEGLVVKTANQGAVVAQMSVEDVLALYVVRENLEGLAARLAATRQPAGLADRLDAINEQLARDAEIGDLATMVRRNLEFHREIRLATDNGYLDRFLGQVEHAVRRLPSSTLAQPERRKAALDEHRAIIAAIRAGDRDAAANAAQLHLRNARASRIADLIGD
ncbi:MAG: FCD domain-containing protein [Streptosporangiales bacterium]|nr:FCD domain-containing protein [Streptosporangiales bacterium]